MSKTLSEQEIEQLRLDELGTPMTDAFIAEQLKITIVVSEKAKEGDHEAFENHCIAQYEHFTKFTKDLERKLYAARQAAKRNERDRDELIVELRNALDWIADQTAERRKEFGELWGALDPTEGRIDALLAKHTPASAAKGSQ